MNPNKEILKTCLISRPQNHSHSRYRVERYSRDRDVREAENSDDFAGDREPVCSIVGRSEKR